MAPPSASSRSTNACEQCRRRKVKCSGDHPCRTCSRSKIECSFSLAGRAQYSDAYVQGLLATIKSQQEHIKVVGGAEAGKQFLIHDIGGPQLIFLIQGAATAQDPILTAQPVSSSSTTGGADLDELSPASSVPTERASGPAFELRVRSLLQQRHTESITSPDHLSASNRLQRNMQNTSTGTCLTSATLTEMLGKAPRSELPSERDSRHLFTLFLAWLGVNQHFLDPRAFADTMALLFRNESSQRRTMESIWFVQYLLVMAMGKLMDFDTPVDTPHGLDYFAEAMNLMPPVHRLSDSGIIGVEILSLVALNLQWRDRKYEAYLNIGIAVRLAVTLGCARPYEEDVQCLPSEHEHRVRVWWTVFMLDRRLSADLGLPVAADDRQLSAQLPEDAPGFPAPQAILINVKIARATGDIMTSLYGNTSLTQLDLVQNIQSILTSLYETGQSIPLEYAIDLARPFPTVTRTGGSLYLMLFQAIILCTRPILLQRVKEKAMASLTQEALDSIPPVISRLCSTCKESAVKSIRILRGLRKKRQIARFGFFDLDATFSAALTLVMVGFVDDVEDSTRMPPELEQAFEILLHLSDTGNRAAEQRLRDMRQFCSFVWPMSIMARQNSMPTAEENENDNSPYNLEVNLPQQGQEMDSIIVAQNPDGAALAAEDANNGRDGGQRDGSEAPRVQEEVSPHCLIDFEGGYHFMDLNMEADEIYSSFHDPNLPLTGVDQLDWAEIEKVFMGRTG